MHWRRQWTIALFKRLDREAIVQLLAGEQRPGSVNWWRARGYRWLMAGLPAGDVFNLIYAKNIWGSEESCSGFGSTLRETENLRLELPALLRQLQIHSLLDIPCGDFNWMKNVELGSLRYTGADIVPELIQETARLHANGNREFLCLDLLTDPLPNRDAILCRDCLVHLPNKAVLQALANIRASGARYLLATTFPGHLANDDIALGFWRPINLERPPFNLPPPVALLHEGNTDPAFADKSLGVWRIADITEKRT